MSKVLITGVKTVGAYESYIGKILVESQDELSYIRPVAERTPIPKDMLDRNYEYRVIDESLPIDLLETGKTIVEYRDGSRRLFVMDAFVCSDSFGNLDDYKSDLSNKFNRTRDIVKIFRIKGKDSLRNMLANEGKLIWVRPTTYAEKAYNEYKKVQVDIDKLKKRELELLRIIGEQGGC